MMKPQLNHIKLIIFIRFCLKFSKGQSDSDHLINAKPRLAFQIIIFLSMPKEIIYVDMSNQYPFTQNGEKQDGSNTIQVRKTLQYDHEPRFICKEKLRMVKSLGFQNLIGLESTKSEENTIILIFQYVPFQFLAEANTLDEEKLHKIKDQLLQLCESLASKAIVHDLHPKRIGLDKRYNLKYFLGVDFNIDKTAEKPKLLEQYQSSVDEYFTKIPKGAHKMNKLSLPQIKVSENVISNADDFEINVRNLLGLQAPTERKILKKSSILESECSNDDLKARKASTRFTFNCDNQIRLLLNEKADNCPENKEESKITKKEDLSARIKILKSYMKEISVKVQPNINKIKDNDNESSNQSIRTKKYLQTPNFSKFEKKVNQFRESRLRKTSKDQEALFQNDHDFNELPNKANQCKSLQQPQNCDKKNICPTKNAENKQSLFNTVINQPNSPPSINFSKKNSVNLCEDDRQHQQYVMLANKDDYCAQFMLFLEDSEACDQKSQRTVKKSSQNERPYITVHCPDSECRPSRKESNLKTQSSENTLQIQSRVQKVIRSSLKLINGLRSRETIRCE